jgi:hypothetical protein
MKTFNPKRCRRCLTLYTPLSSGSTYCSDYCKGRNAYYLRVYGISQNEYEQMVADQNGACAICFGEGFLMNPKHHVATLVVDHCHNSGNVRMLLCHNCNRALGLMKDDVSRIQRAADYIQLFEEGATTISQESRAKWLEAHGPSSGG